MLTGLAMSLDTTDRSGKGAGVQDSGQDVGAMANPPEEAAA